MSIFSQIIAGDIPCAKVYEDDICIAFLDINPITKGHTLVVPREEHIRLDDTPDNILQHLILISKQLMKKMKQKLGADYVQLVVEGLEVPHMHIHLIPNQTGNRIVTWEHVQYEEGEKEKIVERLAS